MSGNFVVRDETHSGMAVVINGRDLIVCSPTITNNHRAWGDVLHDDGFEGFPGSIIAWTNDDTEVLRPILDGAKDPPSF